MVSFNQKTSNYYVRDPRATQQGQLNPFYGDYYGAQSNYGNYAGTPYTPAAYNPYNSPVGVAGLGSAVTYPTTGNFLATAIGSAVNSTVARALGSTAVPLVNNTTAFLAPGYGGSGVNPALIDQYRPTGLADPTTMRLNNNNLPAGASYGSSNSSVYNSTSSSSGGQENRVIVSDPSGTMLGGTLLQPLSATGGVLFPYTPTISFAHRANYESEGLIHTNYEHLYYKNSSVDQITIGAKFTANTAKEAKYIVAAIHFFRSATKMFYGQDDRAGTPPPVLRLDGHGPALLNHLPVVCTSFDFSMPDDVDYISTNIGASYNASTNASTSGDNTMVPTNLQMNIGFKVLYSRNQISNNFGLIPFAQGQLLVKGNSSSGGPGGFI